MDPLLLRLFQMQVRSQAIFFLYAWDDLERFLATEPPDFQAHAWQCIETMLEHFRKHREGVLGHWW